MKSIPSGHVPEPEQRQPAPASTAEPGEAALRDLFVRGMTAIEPSLWFDGAELAMLDGSGTVRTLTIHPGGASREVPVRPADPVEGVGQRQHYSIRLWPITNASARVVHDAAADLDRTREADQRLIDRDGARSLLIVPLVVEKRNLGVLILWRRAAPPFGPEHTATISSLGAFLSVAAERERLWAIEQARHARHAKLEALLPAIGESLDVRKLFPTLSSVIREIVPHDILAFALLSPDRGGVRVQAATDRGVLDLPEYRFSNDEEALDSNWRHLLAYDITPLDASTLRARISPRDAPEPVEVVLRPGPAWMRFVTQAGVRSTLRVPIRAKDRPVGGIAFLAKSSDAYNEEDGQLAARIADHVALALAHQEIADEERRIALAEERALMLSERVETLTRELERVGAHRVLGRSAAWKKALADATQVAATETTVLITGESGTGKEVIARIIHRGSRRARGPFIALNCAALPEHLLESELFGHERGAFTGAVETRAGKIEQAAGGVLFLDEVGEMSLVVQAKFLRVLQEREFQRVGGTRTIKADIRVVAATNRDPHTAIAAGTFRGDLYYRLGVFEIHLPPLRDRPEDIMVLAEAFLEEVGRSVGRPAAGFAPDARETLMAHAWPGNVRELRNAVERAVILCHGGFVTREHLPISVAPPHAASPAAFRAAQRSDSGIEALRPGDDALSFPADGVSLERIERDMIEKAMLRAGQNKSQAAKLLGLSRGQLYSLLRRHGLTQARR